MTELEFCWTCRGTGINGHPDSGYTCYDCNGTGSVMNEHEELKPCPFCGGSADIVKEGRMFGVRCSAGCPMSFASFSSRLDLVAAWNRRAEE